MDLQTWFAFVAASAVLLLIPGPTVLLVLSYVMSQGKRVALAVVCGVALGDLAAMSASLAGLGALVVASSTLFYILKWLGALYLKDLCIMRKIGSRCAKPQDENRRILEVFEDLRMRFCDDLGQFGHYAKVFLIYLGVKMLWRARAAKLGEMPSLAETGTRRAFTQAAIVTALNPKSIVFFIAFVPQFIALDRPLVPQCVVFIGTFVGLAALNALFYAIIAGKLRTRFLRASLMPWFSRFGGATMVAIGVAAALAKNRS